MTEAPRPPARRVRHPLLRRLPLLLVGLLGIWLWQTQVGSERQVIWQLSPTFGRVDRVEIQLREEGGELVKREAWFFQDGRPPDLTQELKLPGGAYQAQVFVTGSDGQTQTVQLPVKIEGKTTFIRVPRP